MTHFNSAAAITPSDTDPNVLDGIYVSAGAAADLVVTPLNGSDDVTFVVNAGNFVPIRTRAVKAATTATVVGLRF